MLTVPDEAVELCKRWEGVSLKAYVCPAGYWTIGYGHLCDKNHPPITMIEAYEYLQDDLRTALAGTLIHCPSLANESSGRLGAIVDFTFNLGAGRLRASTLRRKINEGNWTAVPGELRKWVWGGGRRLPGLVARREAEVALL